MACGRIWCGINLLFDELRQERELEGKERMLKLHKRGFVPVFRWMTSLNTNLDCKKYPGWQEFEPRRRTEQLVRFAGCSSNLRNAMVGSFERAQLHPLH